MAKYYLNERDRDLLGRKLQLIQGVGRGQAPRPKRRRVVVGSGGGGSTSNVVAYAVVTKEAGASSHGSGGITPGAIGECELLAIDGSASGGDALEFRSRHRVPCPVGAIISLDSPHEIADGSVWPDNPDSPGEGEAAVWGSLVDVVDYLYELAGAEEKKSLAIGEAGSGPEDIEWLGAECDQDEE